MYEIELYEKLLAFIFGKGVWTGRVWGLDEFLLIN